MKKMIKPLFGCLLLAAAPLVSAAESSACVKNEAWVVLKVCEEGDKCRSGIVRGETAVFKYQGDEGAKKMLNVYYSDGTIYKYFNNVELKNNQSYIVSGNLFDLSGKIVDDSCPSSYVKKIKS